MKLSLANFYLNPFTIKGYSNSYFFTIQILIFWTLCNKADGHISHLGYLSLQTNLPLQQAQNYQQYFFKKHYFMKHSSWHFVDLNFCDSYPYLL